MLLFQHQCHRAAQRLLSILDALVGRRAVAEDVRQFKTAAVPVSFFAMHDYLIFRNDPARLLEHLRGVRTVNRLGRFF